MCDPGSCFGVSTTLLKLLIVESVVSVFGGLGDWFLGYGFRVTIRLVVEGALERLGSDLGRTRLESNLISDHDLGHCLLHWLYFEESITSTLSLGRL